MLKKTPTKAQLRAELEEKIKAYVEQGGEIKKVPTGVSGWNNEDGNHKRASTPLFNQPRESRTYVPDVVASIDARKAPKEKKRKPPRKDSSPKLKTIYDDFGEPVRRVWVEE